jgi:2-hydroxycyclohexanecarboxyl-CoA dehydrogenase
LPRTPDWCRGSSRLGQPDDYPGLVAFFLSDDAAYITGQTISVSGGLTMHG